MSMQTLTSSFPSSNRSPHRGGLDHIIFYTAPPPAKPREVIPLAADEWPDIDMDPTEFSQHEGPAVVETLDFASRFTGEGRSRSPFLSSGAHSDTRVIRHSEFSRRGHDSAGGDFSFDAFGRTQHPATELFRPLA